MYFSVLISVYKKEKPEYFRRALESIVNQTLQPSEIVVVKDGELTNDLENILNFFVNKYPYIFKIISIPNNVGLGKALAEGVFNCTYEIIARADSDDICHPKRFEKQISFLIKHPEIDVVGSWIAEFEDNENNIYAYRELSTTPDEIKKFAKKRNPMNHMTVVFRKKAVVDAGSYLPFLWFEDYYLWVRMLLNGSRFANLPCYLVNARAGDNMIARRRGIKYAMSEIKIQKRFLDMGFINYYEFIRNVVSRFFVRMLPSRLTFKIYKTILRRFPINRASVIGR